MTINDKVDIRTPEQRNRRVVRSAQFAGNRLEFQVWREVAGLYDRSVAAGVKENGNSPLVKDSLRVDGSRSTGILGLVG